MLKHPSHNAHAKGHGVGNHGQVVQYVRLHVDAALGHYCSFAIRPGQADHKIVVSQRKALRWLHFNAEMLLVVLVGRMATEACERSQLASRRSIVRCDATSTDFAWNGSPTTSDSAKSSVPGVQTRDARTRPWIFHAAAGKDGVLIFGHHDRKLPRFCAIALVAAGR